MMMSMTRMMEKQNKAAYMSIKKEGKHRERQRKDEEIKKKRRKIFIKRHN